jgi:PAS domain S-box-containing protein
MQLQQEEPRKTVSDLEALERLCDVGDRCIQGGNDLSRNLEIILDAAIDITSAEKGNMQLYDAGRLVIAAQRGFELPFLNFFSRVHEDNAATCAAALSRLQRVLVQDVMHSEIFAGHASLNVLLAEGVRAVQSTPLISSTGRVLGMISTHFKRPTSLTDRELRFMDLLARQAADYLERKQNDRALAAKEAQLERIAGSVAVLVVQCTRDLRYIFVNRAFADFIGKPAELIASRQIIEVIGESAFQTILPYIIRVLDGERVEYETEIPYATKGTRYMHVVYVPDRDVQGAVVGFIATIEDFTEQRQAQEKLRDADRHKDQVLALLAHELRNPLAPILNAADVLNTQSPSSSDVSWAAEIISRQAKHMARMLEDLLDASRIARKKLDLRKEYLNIVKLIQSATEVTQSVVEGREHELVLTLPGAPLYVHADPTRLEQAIANLINNAAKYTERQGRIQVTCRRDGSNVLVSVKDNGVGIDPGTLPKLFHLFSQGHQSDGLGIGLWLVREIVAMHGGSIEVTSEGVGKGSEFRVYLPSPQAHLFGAERVQDAPAREDIDVKHRVLVVDDRVEVADSLARLLRAMGHEVYVAYDGASAIDAGLTFRPEVILLDIGLPELDGYDVCRQIRQQSWGKDILIAAVTGWARESDIQHATEAGFDRHLAKPVDRSSLVKLLESVGSRVRSHRS